MLVNYDTGGRQETHLATKGGRKVDTFVFCRYDGPSFANSQVCRSEELAELHSEASSLVWEKRSCLAVNEISSFTLSLWLSDDGCEAGAT
jgi:hypothetical protein